MSAILTVLGVGAVQAAVTRHLVKHNPPVTVDFDFKDGVGVDIEIGEFDEVKKSYERQKRKTRRRIYK